MIAVVHPAADVLAAGASFPALENSILRQFGIALRIEEGEQSKEDAKKVSQMRPESGAGDGRRRKKWR